ncbi:MAG: 23S rRNA pseudouridine2605 synthase [Bradymonadia bacterium]
MSEIPVSEIPVTEIPMTETPVTEKPQRLDKLICDRSTVSRKGARRLIKHGKVLIDGVVQRQADARINPRVTLMVDGEPLIAPPLMLAWHKPDGVVSTTRDPWGRRTLAEALPFEWRERFHAVGRLDLETTGLLLFSADGQLTQWLLHPRRAMPRTYRATISNTPPPDLAERLAAGVETSLGTFTAQVDSVVGNAVQVTVHEGKHRMVRRLLNNAGAPVAQLHRMAFGPIHLGDLAEEALRPLTDAEVASIRAISSKP